jgi:hypothetical protein
MFTGLGPKPGLANSFSRLYAVAKGFTRAGKTGSQFIIIPGLIDQLITQTATACGALTIYGTKLF